MRIEQCIHRCAAGALALGLLCSAATASAQQAVVVEEQESSGPNAWLFNAGLITTGLSYTPALVVAITSDRSEDKYLYAPFVGPWMDLAARDGDSDKVDTTLLVVDGVFQTIGALQIIGSFIFVGGGGGSASAEPDTFQAAVAPTRMSEDGYGLMAVGRF